MPMLAVTARSVPATVSRWAKGRLQSFDDVHCLGGIGQAIAEHEEFVAAEAAYGVRRADGAGEPARNDAEHFVAGRVPEGIVDLLEFVQVAEEQRDRPRVTLSAGQGLSQPVMQRCSVRQSGQRVEQRLLDQLVLRLPTRRVIADHDD